LGLLLTWRVGRRFGPVVGLVSLVLLSTTPVFVGHAFANPKDLPFAVGMMAGVLGLLRWFEAETPTWRTAVGTGLLLGAACCVRAAGLMLLPILVVGQVLVLRRSKDWRGVADRVVPPLVVALGVAWAVMLLPWPWALHNPLVRPGLAVANLVDFQAHDRTMPFAGEPMRTLEPRRDYALHYLALKLPVSVLLGLVLAAVHGRRAQPMLALVAAALLVPLAAVVVLNPVLYDGLRHVLFLVPAACVLAAWGWTETVRRWWRGWVLFVGAAVLVAVGATGRQVIRIVADHPTQAVWFNELAGGLRGVEDRYSLDYYGFSYGPASEALRAYVASDPSLATLEAIPVGAAMPMWAARWTFEAPFVPTRGPSMNEPAPVFYVAYTRGDADAVHPGAKVVATVERDGVVLAVVKDLRRRRGGRP
ncbi:MAG: glycosyltransferase family 39 protein, partial [Myxococcota bacterium]